MKIQVYQTAEKMGQAAAHQAATLIRKTLAEKATANIILATGASQFEMLRALVQEKDIDWLKVRMFHLDEYIGIKDDHPASFRKYLQERFVNKVAPLKAAYFIQGEAPNLKQECSRINQLIQQHPIDVAMIGIGENGHLAFNDPPADFETAVPYIIVELDEACRKQQLGEGWFPNLSAVPEKAISMSIAQILKAKHIICSVPDERKAQAVAAAIKGRLTPALPASILRQHPNVFLYLDVASAKDLK